MANPTQKVASHWTDYDDTGFFWPIDTSSSITFQTGEMIGRTGAGYAAKFDDSAPMEFLGVLDGIHLVYSSSDGVPKIVRVKRAYRLTIPLQTGTAGRADATNGAIGKLLYAYDSGKGIIDSSALTYANVIGRIVDIADSSTQPEALTSTVAVQVEMVHAKRSGGVRTLAATGNQTINNVDVGKLVIVPNTANLTLALPGVANVPLNGEITFFKSTSQANPITLDPNASETIDGSTTVATMDAQYDTITIINLGAAWGIKCQKIA